MLRRTDCEGDELVNLFLNETSELNWESRAGFRVAGLGLEEGKVGRGGASTLRELRK